MGKILICGGAGYIGAHINKLLNKIGYETVVFDNLSTGHREAVRWGELCVGDMADQKALNDLFEKYSFDAVFHLAAFAYVGESVIDPEKYYYNNVVNTLNLLHAMKEKGINKLIFSSSCATYGEAGNAPITEDSPQKPINPYGATKLMVERILKDFGSAYGLQYVGLRYFNAAGADPDVEIGESHNPETHIIPLVLDTAGGIRSEFEIYGVDYDTPDGSCVRDYIHVMDIASAHMLALEYLNKGEKSDFFNLGNEKGTSVLEVIESARRITGRDIQTRISNRRSGDPAHLVGSSNKAKTVLGWQPDYEDIDTIVAHAWQWHENKEY